MSKRSISTKFAGRVRERVRERLEKVPVHPIMIERHVLVGRPRGEVLEGATATELLALLAKKLPQEVTPSPEVITPPVPIEPGQPVLIVKPAQTAEPESIPKKRVLVVGFLPGQQQDIEQKARSLSEIELLFKSQDQLRKSAPTSCQHCIVLSKIGHSVWEKLDDTYGRKHLTMVDGINGAMKTLAGLNSQSANQQVV